MMEQMGEYVQHDAIIMRLEAEIAQINPLFLHEAPKWSIVGVGPLFLGQIASGKMKKEETGDAFVAEQVVGAWQEGTYLMSLAWSNDSGEQRVERLLTIGSYQKKEEVREKLESEALAHFFEIGEVIDQLPSAAETLPYQVTVEGDEIVIRLQQTLTPNHEYHVFLPEKLVASESQSDAFRQYRFETIARPLYVSVSEVKRELGAFGKGMEERSILARMREAGLKAHQLKRMDVNAQDPTFEMMETDDELYYPLTRFVLYEVLMQLSDMLLTDWLMGTDIEPGLLSAVKRYQIADLTVESGGKSDSDMLTVAIKMLDKKKGYWGEALDYWKDALMGHNARGYAKGQATSFRISGGLAPSREI